MGAEQDNILGTMPVGRLVVSMSGPVMCSMLLQAVYNLVDSIYVAQLSDQAFLALSYAYPVQLFMAACCVGLGVGFNAVFAQQLGRKDIEAASQAACHGILLYSICWLFFLLLGSLGGGIFFSVMTENRAVATMGRQYLTICMGLSVGMCIQFITERILQSTGHPAGFMIVQGSGAVINLILDPILIFGVKLGVVGAAVATVTGQITGALIGICLVRRIRKDFSFTFKTFYFQRDMAGEMLRIAAPAAVMQSLSSLMALGLNGVLKLWSETGVFVLGVYFKLQSFVFMPVFGINNALIPVISYNYGARRRERVVRAIVFARRLGLLAALVGMAIFGVFAWPLLRWCFGAAGEALELGVPALWMTALSFPPAAYNVVLSAPFQSLGYHRYCLWIALLRQVVLVLPAALALVLLCPRLVWLCLLIAEGLSALVTGRLFSRLFRERIDSMQEET